MQQAAAEFDPAKAALAEAQMLLTVVAVLPQGREQAAQVVVAAVADYRTEQLAAIHLTVDPEL
jgi:hypothetical protein